MPLGSEADVGEMHVAVLQGPDPVEYVVNAVLDRLKLNKTLDEAFRHFLESPFGAPPPEIVSAARAEIEKLLERNSTMVDPAAVVNNLTKVGSWYAGPGTDDVAWPKYRAHLVGTIGENATQKVDEASTRIMTLLSPPGAEQFDRRGLVLGYVQSGKTTSFISLVAKAYDAGYRMFIVLSGVTDNLRSQTQSRIDEFIALTGDAHWAKLTSADHDFVVPALSLSSQASGSAGIIAVVKKNGSRLAKLAKWLENAGPMRDQLPLLLIDDESDQASIDVGSKGRVSAINKQIRRILNTKKSAYVAYTATPFANLLIDPEKTDDLYPRDFVVSLPRPSGYFGPERIFGRLDEDPELAEQGIALDIVRSVPDGEADEIRPPRPAAAIESWEPGLPPSLVTALDWFLLATTARRLRGRGNPHSTMLIHTSMLALAHKQVASAVRAWLVDVQRGLEVDDPALLDRLRALWDAEAPRGTPLTLETFDDLLPMLPTVAASTRAIYDNYLSSDRLSYEDDATTTIVVGGNTLSRGLTLEGLVSSYFVRSASAYDTLLQMGRWFGYRHHYEDLVRLWMPEELQRWFFDLSVVEAEIRNQIDAFAAEGTSPKTVAIKIRTHPAMAITAAAKMRAATNSQITYDGQRVQTILFERSDKTWLDKNLDAGRTLLASLDDGNGPEQFESGRFGYRDVPVDRILGFLRDYQFSPDSHSVTAELLIKYITAENAVGALREWNVAIVEGTGTRRDGGERPTLDLGIGRPVTTITRSMVSNSKPGQANLKSIASTDDRIADLTLSRDEVAEALATYRVRDGNTASRDTALRRIRAENLGNRGLLLLYPIDKDSSPAKSIEQAAKDGSGVPVRVPLAAKSHVLGLAIYFPDAEAATSRVSYKSVDLSQLLFESAEDEAAEAAAIEAADRDES